MHTEKTFITNYLIENNIDEEECNNLNDALEKTVHYVLTNERTTKMILSAEKMKNMIGIKQYIELLQKSAKYGRCEQRLDETSILYFETETSVYAKTLLENMSRSVFEKPELSEFSMTLNSLRKIRIAFSKSDSGTNIITARLLRATNTTDDYKNAVIIECKSHASRTDPIKLANSIKTIINIDKLIQNK